MSNRLLVFIAVLFLLPTFACRTPMEEASSPAAEAAAWERDSVGKTAGGEDPTETTGASPTQEGLESGSPPVHPATPAGGDSIDGARRAGAGTPVDVAEWQVYRDDRYGIEFRYPPEYVVASEADQPPPRPLIHQVRVLERFQIGSAIENRLPPRFAVDVYANPSGQPLDAWLETSGVIGNLERFSVDPISVGGREGAKLTNSLQLAPNVFYYVTVGPYVYRFTPLGLFGDQILASVTLSP